MPVQLEAFDFFIAIAAIVVTVFVWVAWSTTRPHDPRPATAARLRGWFVGVLAVGIVVGLVVSLGHLPYPHRNRQPDQIIYAVGMQYSWGLSSHPIRTQEQWQDSTYASPIQVRSGSLVQFNVTSFDVNHGFGVFSPSGELLGQVQAMPGYVNHLRLRFTQPGTYDVFCLEMCGMEHYLMRGEFEVVPRVTEHAAAHRAAHGPHG